MPKLAILTLWLVLTPATILSSFFLLQRVQETKAIKVAGISVVQTLSEGPPYQRFAALPSQISGLSESIISGDARVFILRNFLSESPLENYSELMVFKADEYGLDFRLIPAIAMVESGAGRVIPEGSHNAWGFENGATDFPSWEHAIDRVALTLRTEYVDKGLETPQEIMPKYAPPSVLKGGPWAQKVNFFFAEMDNVTLVTTGFNR